MSINIDMSFLDAPARGGAASRHLEETCVLRSNLTPRSTTDDALSLARRLENIQGTMHECHFKAPAVENVRDDASTRARAMRTRAWGQRFLD